MAKAIKVEVTDFGIFNGQSVMEYTLTNGNGAIVCIINYGCIISKIIVPDRDGKLGDVVTGFETFDGFLQKGNPYFGAIIGRYANRIAGGEFELEGKKYKLALNAGENSLHGGIIGFDKVSWDAEILEGKGVKMSYLSKNGEEGYPGNLKTEIIFSLTEDNEVILDYYAETDMTTPVNLTSHPYFNLSAWKEDVIYSHELQINASKYTAVNQALIPTGELTNVSGTPLDFTSVKTIGKDIEQTGGGYDNNFALDGYDGTLILAATASHPGTGRKMEVFTTEPGLQLYTTNSVEDSLHNTKGGIKYCSHGAFCLEAQHFPDSPNHPDFPDTILHPGEEYRQTTIYKFSVC